MKKIVFVLATLTAIMSLTVACEKEPSVSSDEEKTFYALGAEVGNSLNSFGLSEHEANIVALGMKDKVLNRKAKLNSAEFMGKIRELSMNRMKSVAQKEMTESDKYLGQMAAQAGVVKKDSGLIYKETKPGTGPAPKSSDVVKVHYEGKLRDGTVFDSSVKRGEPATFPLAGVIPCWTEALQLMKVGGKSTIYCPSKIAYGDRGSPPVIPGGAALAFEVELLGIEANTPKGNPKVKK